MFILPHLIMRWACKLAKSRGKCAVMKSGQVFLSLDNFAQCGEVDGRYFIAALKLPFWQMMHSYWNDEICWHQSFLTWRSDRGFRLAWIADHRENQAA